MDGRDPSVVVSQNRDSIKGQARLVSLSEKYRNDLPAPAVLSVAQGWKQFENPETSETSTVLVYEVLELANGKYCFMHINPVLDTVLIVVHDDPILLFTEVEDARHDDRAVDLIDAELAALFMLTWRKVYDLK